MSTCRSCDREIEWVVIAKSGKSMPIEHGLTVRRTGGNHYKVETDHGPVFCSGTPRVGDIVAQRLRRDLRAKGVEL